MHFVRGTVGLILCLQITCRGQGHGEEISMMFFTVRFLLGLLLFYDGGSGEGSA